MTIIRERNYLSLTSAPIYILRHSHVRRLVGKIFQIDFHRVVWSPYRSAHTGDGQAGLDLKTNLRRARRASALQVREQRTKQGLLVCRDSVRTHDFRQLGIPYNLWNVG